MKRSRVLSLVLALCLLVTMVPHMAHESSAATEKNAYRFFGQTRYETAFKTADALKTMMEVDKFSNIVVACGTDFADALGGSYLAAVKQAPILLVSSTTTNQVKDYIRANLKPGGTVYLLGGTSAVPASMEKGLDSFTVKRLGGATRYDTNLKILYEAGVKREKIIICTGTNYADSLSASALGLPILLVKNEITAEQRAFLKTTSGDKIIIGGYSAVSEAIENKLDNKGYGTGDVERIDGSNRYETSVLVAQWFFDNPDVIIVAYGKNFPDGLCAGVYAHYMNRPLILSANGQENPAAAYVKQQNIEAAYVWGGSRLISDESALRLVAGFSYSNSKTVLPNLTSFLGREPDSDRSNYRSGRRLVYEKIPDKVEDKVVKEVLALLQQDKYQLELIGVRISESSLQVIKRYDFLYVGDGYGIDLLSAEVGEEKLYNVELEVLYSKKDTSHTNLYLHFGKGFALVDPGTRVSVSLPGPDSGSGGSSGSGDCIYCNGSGRCRDCDGVGTVRKWVAGTTHDFVTQDCTSCVGGDCRWCYGSGDA